MWVRSAAIRPVPYHAQLPIEALAEVEAWLGDEDVVTERRLGEVFERFEAQQPQLAARAGHALGRTHDDVAVALGYFLSLVVWRAFEQWYGVKLCEVDEVLVASVEEALALDEQLRGEDPTEPLDSDDVIAMEQPYVLQFIHEHIDAALDIHADDVDVDAVHRMYRMVLVELLALSYSIAPPEDHFSTSSEIHA